MKIQQRHRGTTSTSAFKILSRMYRRGAHTEIVSRRKSMTMPVAFVIAATINGEHPATSRFSSILWATSINLCTRRLTPIAAGTCQRVNVAPAEENLHYAWDDAVVAVLEKQLGTTEPEATAHKLEALYPVTDDLKAWKPAESEQIAWESHQLAETDVYGALGIPERSCSMHSCDPATSKPVTMSSTYMDRAGQVAGRQLAKAGYRLAALLNQICKRAVPPSTKDEACSQKRTSRASFSHMCEIVPLGRR